MKITGSKAWTFFDDFMINWDVIQTYIQQGIGRLEYAFKWFASQIKLGFIIGVNITKLAFINLADIIVSKVCRRMK